MAEDVSFTVILCFRVFFGLLLVHFSTASCEQVDVGVSWYILDNQLNASSELNASTPAKNGRLNFVGGSSWCASTSDTSPYLQIDLQTPYIVCAVSTQGNSQGNQWVETYTIQSSKNGTNWTDYKENGKVKTFNGNFDQNTVEKQILFSAFLARYLRFVVGSTHGGACLRVEVFGIPRSRVPSNIALFKNASQSSDLASYLASNAVDGDRGTHISKCTHTQKEYTAWWRVDLGRLQPVAEVNIVNRGDCCGRWLDGAEIRVGNETTNGGANNHLCADNIKIPQGSSKTYFCSPKAYGRYLYIRLPGRNTPLTLCEVEVYSYLKSESCAFDPVGVSDSSVIFDQRFSALSYDSGYSPSDGRLKGSNAWIPATNNNNSDFLQIDLGSLYFVCGVATQGTSAKDQWTKTYKIETSLDNDVWAFYSEGGSEKVFTGNVDRNSIVRNELSEPVAAKFIRFYPVEYMDSKALRVEVYGSKQGCFVSFKNERGKTRDFTITYSSEDGNYRANFSRLYGTHGWCSSSVSRLPQYLQADFGQIVTVTGVATQGDARRDNWVTSYLIHYGYDGKTWISYGGGQHLTGNSDRNTTVVNWFAPPFAARYVRVVPKRYTGAVCMRMDLFGCKNFQVSLPLNIDLDDVRLIADPKESVTLTCVASYSPRQPSGYSWIKDGTGLSDNTSSLNIPYNSASNIYSNYCARKLQSASGVQCNSSYQCSASLSGIQGRHLTTANVIVSLKKPRQPVVQVRSRDVKARSTSVTWSHNPGADEMPVTSYNLEYRNSTSTDDITLGVVLSKLITNLKPYTPYSVRLVATSVLGKGLWSNFQNFTTRTAKPEVDVQIVSVTSVTSQSILVKWQTPSMTNLNGPFRGYSIEYKEEGKPSWKKVNVRYSSTDKTLQSLKKWTVYFIRIAVSNGDFLGPPGPEKQVRTLEDAPSKPLMLGIKFTEPSETTMPRMTINWQQPAEQNGIIKKYRLVFTYTIDGRQTTITSETNNQTFWYSLDVLGGIQYGIEIWAETVKPGPRLTGTQQVPEYKPSASPHNITSEKMNETTYRISWNPLPRNISNGIVIAYEVNQTKLFTSRTVRSVSTPSILQNISDTFIVLTGLTSCSVYKVEVRAYTSAGPGVFGRLTGNIATTVPGEPTEVKTENPGKRSITLRWGKPKLHGDDVRRYKIIYKGTKDYYPEFEPHIGIQETESPTLTMKITDLYPGTKYTFVVRAENHCVYGGNSSMAQGSTKVDAPVAPFYHEVQVIVTKETPVNVTVWPAKQTNGPISDYQVLVHQVNDWTDEVSDWNTLGTDVYIAAQIPANSINPSIVFVVGDAKTYDGYENKQLSTGHKYKIYSRGLALRVTKKRSLNQNYLLGKASLIAKVQIVHKSDDAGRQGGDVSPQTCGKPSNTASVISSIVLAVALIISLGVNLYQWRARGISKTGEKYSAEEFQVKAHQIEGGDEEVPSPKVESFYMELQPIQIQQTTRDSEYGSLVKNPEGDGDDDETRQDYANVAFHRLPKQRENKVYQNI